MSDDEGYDSLPTPAALADVFHVEERRAEEDRVVYVGEPLLPTETLERQLWPLFREAGYDVRLQTITDSEEDPISGVQLRSRRHALVATPAGNSLDGIPWTNVIMFALTVVTTLFVGSIWYHEPAWGPVELVTGENWKFSAAVLSVLATHELGHYVFARYHDVNASLPYFIPFPTLIGTMGAVIRMKGRLPSRKALFDIGVAGPLAGLVATVVVTIIGLTADPITVPQRIIESSDTVQVQFGYPPLIQLLAELVGQPLEYPDDPTLAVSPIVFGGWTGMFITFLNLIPVGQLDGGHILRAMAGERAESISNVVPGLLFGLAAYLFFFTNSGRAAFLWGIWGGMAVLAGAAGFAEPIYDEPLDRGRFAIGAFTFLLGALCFVPVPFQLMS
ncbi:site-2 protease family protein [Halosegnis rubeus]|uniref:Site-2 protease family protein n=1 Tax=Halosegnis rubeus TaxID=2212850 RepID=A0A5N5UGN9_9EURY|nr:site-2 protease family protein [Halosegnis rubeus]KAB7517896.1 site-2 protease family protein [Halosegnis rubeus]